MNWKLIMIGSVVLSLLVFIAYFAKDTVSSYMYQGFQNPNALFHGGERVCRETS